MIYVNFSVAGSAIRPLRWMGARGNSRSRRSPRNSYAPLPHTSEGAGKQV